MKKTILLLQSAWLLVGLAAQISAQTSAGEADPPTLMNENSGIELDIRFFDTSIYYLDSDILIQVRLRNRSDSVYRFKLADNRLFNIDFDVRTPRNQPLAVSQQFITERLANQQIFYREIALQPGEEYAFVENLRSYIDIPESGVYVISARFFPELTSSADIALSSRTRLNLSVRPPEAGLSPIDSELERSIREIVRREPLPPDQVIEFILEARQRMQWERFLLYFDLESLLLSEPARARRYELMSEADRQREIERFRDSLQNETIETEISAIPDEFRIIQTSYTPDQGEVVAELRFERPRFTEVKQYTYLLRRDDEAWEIYDFSVQNISIE